MRAMILRVTSRLGDELLRIAWRNGRASLDAVSPDLQSDAEEWVALGVSEWIQGPDGSTYSIARPDSEEFLPRLKAYLSRRFLLEATLSSDETQASSRREAGPTLSTVNSTVTMYHFDSGLLAPDHDAALAALETATRTSDHIETVGPTPSWRPPGRTVVAS